MFNVHIRVIDASTKRPAACRIRIADVNGRSFPPLGRVGEFAVGRNEDVGGQVMLDGHRWYYIDGGCETPLPAATPLSVQIWKGPEYTPIRREITLGPGQMALRFEIARWANFKEAGWYSGDGRCHFLSPHAALLEGLAEDLAVVNLLAAETTLMSHDGVGAWRFRIWSHSAANSRRWKRTAAPSRSTRSIPTTCWANWRFCIAIVLSSRSRLAAMVRPMTGRSPIGATSVTAKTGWLSGAIRSDSKMIWHPRCSPTCFMGESTQWSARPKVAAPTNGGKLGRREFVSHCSGQAAKRATGQPWERCEYMPS